MNVSVVGAHPDDIELLCGGTLAKYVKKGHNVTFIIATNGEAGSFKIPKEEFVKVRYKEAKKGASVIGADLIWLGFQDAFLYDTKKVRLTVINALRKAKAEVLFTHYPDYYHPDRGTIGKIVNDAAVLLTNPNIITEFSPLKKLPFLYLMDTSAGIGFEPEEYVDITDVFEIKKKALLSHESQHLLLKEFGGKKADYMVFMETQARFRGYQAGVKYAEAFIAVKSWSREVSRHLLPQYL